MTITESKYWQIGLDTHISQCSNESVLFRSRSTLKYFRINHGDQSCCFSILGLSRLIINVLVSFFCFIWIPMLSVYGHYKSCNSISAGIDFRHQNQTRLSTSKVGPRAERVIVRTDCDSAKIESATRLCWTIYNPGNKLTVSLQGASHIVDENVEPQPLWEYPGVPMTEPFRLLNFDFTQPLGAIRTFERKGALELWRYEKVFAALYGIDKSNLKIRRRKIVYLSWTWESAPQLP